MPEIKNAARKRVLFLHPNFPAQFRNVAISCAAAGHDTRFLCQTHYGRTLPGVVRLKLKGDAGHDALVSHPLTAFKRSQKQAKQYRAGFEQLARNGWSPDVVISHSAWGCGMYVKEHWPDTHHVSYLEWWFNPESEFFHYDAGNRELNVTPSQIAKSWERNQSMALELMAANEVVAPTEWQRNQLPRQFRQNCRVIPDGVDLSRFSLAQSRDRSIEPVLTYGTRGMEPMRGFPQFIRSLPYVLSSIPNLTIQIAGLDEVNYAGKPPKGFDGWGEWARQYLIKKGVDNRVTWLGFLDGKKYSTWLKSSWCHVYLTHPFVASWSLLDALATGIPVVASDVEPIQEFCNGLEWVQLADHRDVEGLSRAMVKTLLQAPKQASPTELAERFKQYGIETSRVLWGDVAGLKLTTNH